ncbi:hypothetical protein AVEN_190515-1 [Araneus ventricosus]|uniref:ZSWIM1/3 RNaseH-like domain-containing protein n=1 Tax=Araneus ventricosus TaxID=182803 RepID=A0A4Y2MLP2_ARAVE|nr:hypothetical protein AVEN_190515-1 [Araneus ventricosus]
MNKNKKFEAGEVFDDYEQFVKAFNDFCEENYHPLIIVNNNKRQITILCRHGYNCPSKSTGQRTKLRYNYLGCGAKISCYKLANSKGIRITNVNLQHNHGISKAAYHSRVAELFSEEKEVLTDLHEANCKVSQICRVFHSKFDGRLSSQKIRNVLKKLVPQTSNDTSQLQTFLKCVEETGGDVFCELDPAGNVAILFLSSYVMKKSFETSHATVVQIGASFDFDKSKYKLCDVCYLNPKTNRSEFCAPAFLSEETATNFRKTFQYFRKICTQPSSIFIVDKDFNEISVLKEVFGRAIILLCYFHVLKYVKNLITTAPVIVEVKSDIMTKFKKMLDAGTEDIYEEHKKDSLTTVKTVQVRVNKKYVSLEDQFINNWDSCKEMWVAYFRKCLATLGDNTNNRIEISFWTLKQSIHVKFPTLPVIEKSIIHLISFCDQRINEEISDSNLKSLKIFDADMDINALNAESSLYLNDRGCILFHKSLKALQSRKDYMTIETDCVREKYEVKEVVYKCSTNSCNGPYACDVTSSDT